MYVPLRASLGDSNRRTARGRLVHPLVVEQKTMRPEIQALRADPEGDVRTIPERQRAPTLDCDHNVLALGSQFAQTVW